MKTSGRALLLLPSLLLTALGASTDLEDLKAVTLLDLAGNEIMFSSRAATKTPLVVAYTGVGCPISNKYASRLNELSERYGPKGVRFMGVNASPQDSRKMIGVEAKELGLGIEIYKDFRQELTRALGAKTTTQVYLFDAEGELQYSGAIDDQYSLGAAKPAPTKRYLVLALEAVLKGETPPVGETPAPGCLLTILPEEELPEAVTWTRHIAPILQENCETCHRPEQAGPFALQTYEQARGWGKKISLVVAGERMPPWNARKEFNGMFSNERRLGPKQQKQLLAWVDGGMPRGVAAEAPGAKKWPAGWSIGEPDVVFEMQRDLARREVLSERGFEVPREGVVAYRYFTTETTYPEDRWIRAVETRAGAPDVVRHIFVFADESEKGDDMTRRRGSFKSYLAAGVPGEHSRTYPLGHGRRLPAGARLVFQVHYIPNGKERFDRSSLGLVFCDEKPEFEVVTDALFQDEFVIPPGASNHEVRVQQRIVEDTGILAFLPRMHTRGKDLKYTVHYPDGGTQDLLAVEFDYNWQESYVLADPFFLPAGSRLECVGHFDNSEQDADNPDPQMKVEWGEQNFEEMFIGYFDYARPVE